MHLARGDSEGQGERLMQSEVLQLRSVAWLLEGMGLKNRDENALQYHAMNFSTLLMRVPVGFCLLVGRIRRPHIVACKCNRDRGTQSRIHRIGGSSIPHHLSPDGDFIAGSVPDHYGVRK